ncbi:hypothetical protein JZ751_012012 [Albula glossodonta]|uniref:Uncharacterized protein n=1 Tax=Albula glossodonta TaxID=121402 RepID=A0A8T2PRD5_9TELE|nr:hypothetical protein JZ751_012012 [Albula glossodonta]
MGGVGLERKRGDGCKGGGGVPLFHCVTEDGSALQLGSSCLDSGYIRPPQMGAPSHADSDCCF